MKLPRSWVATVSKLSLISTLNGSKHWKHKQNTQNKNNQIFESGCMEEFCHKLIKWTYWDKKNFFILFQHKRLRLLMNVFSVCSLLHQRKMYLFKIILLSLVVFYVASKTLDSGELILFLFITTFKLLILL